LVISGQTVVKSLGPAGDPFLQALKKKARSATFMMNIFASSPDSVGGLVIYFVHQEVPAGARSGVFGGVLGRRSPGVPNSHHG
jgi:hypothetical protein